MAKLGFADIVEEFGEQFPEAVEALYKESTSEIVAMMQLSKANGGNMPVRTGFLRASLLASVSALPAIGSITGSGKRDYNPSQVEATIAAATIDDTLYFGYTAAYAAHREFGANGTPPDGFVRLAAQNWLSTVDRNWARIKSLFGM